MAEEARIIIDAQLQFRHDSEAAWLEHDPVLKAGEPAYTLGYPDRFKLGDGQSKWSELPYIKPGEGGGGGGGGSQSYESLSWQAIKGLTAGDPSILPQAFAVKQAYNELKSLIPALDDYYTKTEVDSRIPSLAGYATQTFVNTAIANLINGAPTTLDTLKEIADALADNADVVEALESAIGTKADKTTVDALDTRLDSAEANISTNTTNITAQGKTIASHTTSINTLSSDVSGLKTSVSDLEDLFDSDGKALKAVTADNASKLGGQLPSYYATASSVATLQGYFTNGVAKNADKLDGNDSTHFAAASALAALTTRVSTAETNITNLTNNKLNKSVWDSVFEIDSNGNLKVKVGLYSPKFISSREADPNTGGGSGGAFSLYTWAQVKALTSEVGGVAPTAYALKQAYNEIGVSLDGKASTSSVTALTTRVASLESKATSVSVSQTLTTGTEIGKITIDGVSKALYAPSSIAWGSVTGKPSFATVATSGKYSDLSGTPTSLPASDVYAWAKAATKPSYTAAEVGALATSGGTISNRAAGQALTIHRSNTNYDSMISFSNDTDGLLGRIGISGTYNNQEIAPRFYKADGTNYTLLHAGNYATEIGDYYLKSSGGTIKSGSKSNPFNIDTDDTTSLYMSLQSGGVGKAFLVWNAGAGVYLQDSAVNRLGLLPNGTPFYRTNNTNQTLLHSGNYSDYALKLDGSNARATKLTSSESLDNYNYGFYSYTNGNNPTNSFGDNTAIFAFASNRGNDIWQIAFDGNGITQTIGPRFGIRGNYAGQGWTSWYRIATTDSNVASATKLQTPRTIWGQSFDGTGNVSGNLTLGNAVSILGTDSSAAARSIMSISSENSLIIGHGSSAAGIPTYINGSTLYFRYGTSRTLGMLINSSGNVTIGSSDLAGTSAKLYVDGRTALAGIFSNRYGASGNNAGADVVINKGSDYFGMGASSANISNFSFGLTSDPQGTWKSEILTITNGGNVLIGTTTASGYKLEVNGTFRATGNATVAGLTATTGTFSGALSATDLVLSSNLTLHYQIFFKRANACYIWGVSGSAFHFGSDAVGGTSPACASLSIYSDSVTSGNRNNAVSLGSASYRWSTIYGVNGDFSGTIYSATGVYSTGYVSARGADTSSDRRLKDNIAPLRNALNYVLGTNYVSFDWKDTREKSIGIIAQEEMGREWGCLVQKHSETYSYLYGQHTALLGAAIQEEDKKVEELKRRIQDLENEVKRLKQTS